MPMSPAASAPTSRTGQEGPDADGGGEAGALEEVERRSPWMRCVTGGMTLDETPRGSAGGGEPRNGGRARPFHDPGPRAVRRAVRARARRSMKSSAMRDLMAVTQRPEVISLAGGLPDTSTFPAEDFAALMARVAVDSCAARAAVRPDRGPRRSSRTASSQVMAAEGMSVDPDESLVTTGGQQVIDLVCKTLLDPGDVVIAEAPTYPGAVPVFGAYQADVVQIEMDDDGMRVDLMEEALDRLDAEGRMPEVHLHDPVLPEPGRRDDVAGAPAAAGRGRPEPRDARARGQPVRAAALRGRAAADAVLARRRRVRHLPRDVLEDPLPRAAARLGGRAAAGAGEDEPRQAGRRPLLVAVRPSTSSPRTSPTRDWRALPRHADGALPRAGATRCSTRWPSTSRARRRGRGPQGGLFIWATLPDYIDTTDLLARALREENVAFVPGRAAYLDGRGGSSMRLNFSGVGDDDIREGVRRIGKVVREQVALYGTLTGAAARGRARGRPRRRRPGRARQRRRCCRCAGGRGEPRRRPQGWPLARAPGLAALGARR